MSLPGNGAISKIFRNGIPDYPKPQRQKQKSGMSLQENGAINKIFRNGIPD
jgi:hypothetical protein